MQEALHPGGDLASKHRSFGKTGLQSLPELLLIHTGDNNTLDKEALGDKEQDQREKERQ